MNIFKNNATFKNAFDKVEDLNSFFDGATIKYITVYPDTHPDIMRPGRACISITTDKGKLHINTSDSNLEVNIK